MLTRFKLFALIKLLLNLSIFLFQSKTSTFFYLGNLLFRLCCHLSFSVLNLGLLCCSDFCNLILSPSFIVLTIEHFLLCFFYLFGFHRLSEHVHFNSLNIGVVCKGIITVRVRTFLPNLTFQSLSL